MDEFVSKKSVLDALEWKWAGKAAIDAVKDLTPVNAQISKWISVKDGLPDSQEDVLLYYEREAWRYDNLKPYRKKEIGIGWQYDGRWHVSGCTKVVGLAWIPLPEPPKGV